METIKIPSKKHLTAKELYDFKNQQVVIPKTGLKRTTFENTEEENAELKVALENLRKQITNYRIERIGSRSKAEWQYETKTVKLTKKVGKFNSFGYTKSGEEFLRNHEALYLIEMNRLELYFNSILVSVEQAYILLLGEERSKNYDKYFIYSFLSRTGYVVQSYENHINNKPTNYDCIWEILYESLNPNYKIPDNFKKEIKFNIIKESFNNVKDNIKNYKHSDNFEAGSSSLGIDFNRKIAGKRKLNEKNTGWINSKKHKLSPNIRSKSFLNSLTNEPEYVKFKNIFDQFGKFQVPQNYSKNNDEFNRILEIDFDLYLSKLFQKSKRNQPLLRVVIMQYDEIFPNYAEITRCYNSQSEKIPLVVVTLSESKHLQGFLYHFN